jgi:predicted nucleic acid-binding protein
LTPERLLLDSDALIDYATGRPFALDFVHNAVASGAAVGITPVQITEFLSGTRPERRTAELQLLAGFVLWEITWQSAVAAGLDRYHFSRIGVQISTPDALTAAVARERGAILVTRNRRHYPMSDIEILTPGEAAR